MIILSLILRHTTSCLPVALPLPPPSAAPSAASARPLLSDRTINCPAYSHVYPPTRRVYLYRNKFADVSHFSSLLNQHTVARPWPNQARMYDPCMPLCEYTCSVYRVMMMRPCWMPWTICLSGSSRCRADTARSRRSRTTQYS